MTPGFPPRMALPLQLKGRWYTPCMAKLERLPWIDAFCIAGFGVKIGVRVSDASLVPALLERMPPGGGLDAEGGEVDRMISIVKGGDTPRPGVRTYHLVYVDHDRACRSLAERDIFDAYDTHVRVAFAQFSHERLFVHAGAVAWDGRAIIFPGRSLAGKTSLVAAFLKAGAGYLSDEYAILEPNGMVHPFAKPLSIRPSPTARQEEVPAARLGARAVDAPVPLGLIVMARYEEGAAWQPRTLPPAQAALALMEHAVGARMDPRRTVEVLSGVALSAETIASVRPDVAITVKAIQDYMIR